MCHGGMNAEKREYEVQCREYFGKTSIYIVAINIGLLKGKEFEETLQKIMV